MSVALTWDQVLTWRMERQFLDRPPGTDTVQVVRRLAGVQAQVASYAEHAVATRTADATSDVAGALAERRILKTWAQRGTLHLLAADDAAAYLSLLAAARTWEKSAWQRTFATAEQMAKIAEAVVEVLDGVELTREELGTAIIERTGDPSLGTELGSGWGAVLKPLAWQGLLCNGLNRDGRVTFTSPSSWLPGWEGLPDPADAAAVAIPAYLGAHGPASPTTFDLWLLRGGTRKAVLKGWFTGLEDAGALTRVDVQGDKLFARTADLDVLAATTPSQRLRLLPAFDQYVLGAGTADPQVVPLARRPLVSKAAGWISPVVVVGGRVAGTWEADGGALAIALFDDVGTVDRAVLDEEIAILEKILDRSLAASISSV